MRRPAQICACLSVAAIVLTAGCSTTVSGAPELSTAIASASTADTDPGTSVAEETEFTDPTSDDTSELTGKLDGASDLYFATFCIAADEVSNQLATLNDVDEADYSAEELQDLYVTTLTDAGRIAGNSVGVLEKAPNPEFVDADKVRDAAIERFTSLETVLTRGAANIDALLAPGKSELRTELDAVREEISQTLADTEVEIDAGVLAAAREIPECAGTGL